MLELTLIILTFIRGTPLQIRINWKEGTWPLYLGSGMLDSAVQTG